MSEPTDIHTPLFDICERLELNPNLVAKMTITPYVAEVDVYLTRNGSKFVKDDGKVAIEHRTIRITTV